MATSHSITPFDPNQRHPNFTDRTGQRFGRLTVIRCVGTTESNHPRLVWECQCDCGTTANLTTDSLTSGKANSCGCYMKERAAAANTTHGHASHKGKRSSEYYSWSNMIDRCERTTNHAYPRYGGRGITVCNEWHSFETFLSDMGLKPFPRATIERKNNNGPYCKDNCEWATYRDQANNRRSSRIVTYQGESMTLMEASRRTGLHESFLRRRLAKGMTIDEAVAAPRRAINRRKAPETAPQE